MITEIRNKITSIGETVTSNFYYETSGKNNSKPRCVYKILPTEKGNIDTKSEFEDIYFWVTCYQTTDGNAESLASSIESAFKDANKTTTNYRCLNYRHLGREPYPIEAEVKGTKRLITKFYIYYEKI